MAGKKTIKAGPWPLGVFNAGPESDVPTDEHGRRVALREAENVDISDAGFVSRRDGTTKVQSASRGHSAYSDDYLPHGLYVDNGTLYALLSDESRVAVATGLSASLPVSFARLNDLVLFTNGVQSGQIGMDLSIGPWSAGAAPGQPTLTAQGGGQLDSGLHQVVVTYLDPRGRESGAAAPATVEVAANGAIALSDIPQPKAGWSIRVYLAGPNDVADGNAVFRASLRLDSGVTSAVIDQRPTSNITCSTMLLMPMPPGQIVAVGAGRQFVARGDRVLYSPALRYGLYDRRSQVEFDGRVQQMAFVGDGTDMAGLYVADKSRTYWLSGADPKDWRPVIARPYGALPGQLGWVPGEVWGYETGLRLPMWVGSDGVLCVGLPGGRVTTPSATQGGQAAYLHAADGAAVFYRDDARRVIAALDNPIKSRFQMRDELIVREYPRST